MSEAGNVPQPAGGTGTPRRECLDVDDLADALVFLVEGYSEDEHIDIGRGKDVNIAELGNLTCEIVGFAGAIRCAPSKPDGTSRKLLDVTPPSGFGWRPRGELEVGLADAYRRFLENVAATV
jgi:GDP-L-fucose synthase